MSVRLGPWPARVAEIGYSVAPWACRRGLATIALDPTCRWAFDAFDLDRIEWRAVVGNIASRRAAEKAGFTVDGTRRADLHRRPGQPPSDSWTGALLRTDR